MKRYKYTQLDLFPDIGIPKKDAKKQKLHYPYVFKYEKIILISISYIIISVAAFSMGVERGKNIVGIKNKKTKETTIAIAQSKKQVSRNKQLSKNNQNIAKQEGQRGAKKERIINRQKNKYTIQVATYLSNRYAKIEMERLKKIGFVGHTINIGKYILLCVGKFTSKKDAKAPLKKLKSRYNDCFIRKL